MAAGADFGEFLQDQLQRARPRHGAAHVRRRRRLLRRPDVRAGVRRHALLSVDDGNRGAFEAEGLAPFTYDGKGRTIVLPYWRVPERLFDEPDEMVGVGAGRAGGGAARGGEEEASRGVAPMSTPSPRHVHAAWLERVGVRGGESDAGVCGRPSP